MTDKKKEKQWYMKDEHFNKSLFGVKRTKKGRKAEEVVEKVEKKVDYKNLFIGGQQMQFVKDRPLTKEEVKLFEPYEGIEGNKQGTNLKQFYLEQR